MGQQSLNLPEYRSLLIPIARNLVGNVEDAEDIVQEAMLKWLSMENRDIQHERGYLVKTVVNKSLNFIRDRKRALSKNHELIEDGQSVEMPTYIEKGSDLSLGMLMLLEKLNASERAVFLLKEIFGYSHKEIAEILGISEANARQILSRAKRHLNREESRYEADPVKHIHLYQKFIDVCQGENLSELLEILKEDIQIDISRPAAQLQRVEGAVPVAEYLMAFYRSGITYEWMWLKDLPALVAWQMRKPIRVIKLEGNGEQISQVLIEELTEERELIGY
ncbi:sigma-70 family RNA polymerase sigma factor [Pontibacter sp. G13]|uniref:sigma-70 family RNA polymerase sigma factor n=1 Tax=Pontibacter sp. G13 TaxID=3074898 RepID=UPI00288A6CA4|nr:sigma-70 family RNA polymerase sigma factor [Pontibacter sp. G13]WNJ21497.1 sigma-70 family RNA polymerase sigma factor [Pontibacter sp. G13]